MSFCSLIKATAVRIKKALELLIHIWERGSHVGSSFLGPAPQIFYQKHFRDCPKVVFNITFGESVRWSLIRVAPA